MVPNSQPYQEVVQGREEEAHISRPHKLCFGNTNLKLLCLLKYINLTSNSIVL